MGNSSHPATSVSLIDFISELARPNIIIRERPTKGKGMISFRLTAAPRSSVPMPIAPPGLRKVGDVDLKWEFPTPHLHAAVSRILGRRPLIYSGVWVRGAESEGASNFESTMLTKVRYPVSPPKNDRSRAYLFSSPLSNPFNHTLLTAQGSLPYGTRLNPIPRHVPKQFSRPA